jgi:hypothetical protein
LPSFVAKCPQCGLVGSPPRLRPLGTRIDDDECLERRVVATPSSSVICATSTAMLVYLVVASSPLG